MHQDSLVQLISLLSKQGYKFFEIETNGTIIPSHKIINLVSWWNCSPKLSNNLLSEGKRINQNAIQAIVDTGKADFKFVVRNRDDVEEILRSYGDWIPANRIWLMPEGKTRERQLKRMQEISELCKQFGFKLSPRLHILNWDNERKR